jgi:oxygen-independent coproporphyrinogen III oxidase
MISTTLVEKYNKALPRYTSYPPATSFHTGFGSVDYKEVLIASNNTKPQSISLYVHIPFCPRLCLYCGCTTKITRDQLLIENYLESLHNEIIMVAQWLDLSRPVTQIHFGGGTPNALSIQQVSALMQLIYKTFSVSPTAEIAIECNPAYLTIDYLNGLVDNGFNRVSLGIQDFNPEVLKQIHRDRSLLPVEQLTAFLKSKNIGVNLDFIYGLPLQTVESFTQSIQKAIDLKPDRLVTFSYAHVPWVKSHQSALEKMGLPDAQQKFNMFSSSFQLLTGESNYVPIGLDHFALPDDTLSKALSNQSLHRNFQGYCTLETTGQVYAFGMSAISQMSGAYAQNAKDLKTYMELVNNGQPATERGLHISREEQLVREVITDIMCNNYLSWEKVAARTESSAAQLKEITKFSISKMQNFIDDGLLLVSDNDITITDTGRFTIRNIAAAFDPKLNDSGNCFSNTI